MTGIQIFLILLGVVTVVGSFVFSDFLDSGGGTDGGNRMGLSDETIRNKIDAVVETAVDNAVEDAIEERLEKTEAQLEKMSNEKIMAVNDYSDTVLTEINKNHEEVMFLYGMLNDKETEIKNTVKDVEAVKKSVKNMKEELAAESLPEEPVSLEEAAAGEGDVAAEDILANRENNAIAQESNLDKEADNDFPDIPNRESADIHLEDKRNQSERKRPDEDVTEFRISVKPEKKGVAIKAGNSGKNNNQRILDLYEQGKTNVEIAKELGLGIGEVRLVIDLYKNKRR